MGVTVAISIICLILAGLLNGRMDAMQFRGKGPGDTWRNKWKKDAEGKLIPAEKAPWYYFGIIRPEFVEAFPYSSTLLVWLTDPWHGTKTGMMACFRTAIVLMATQVFSLPWWGWIVVWVVLLFLQAGGFHLAFRRPKQNKTKVNE